MLTATNWLFFLIGLAMGLVAAGAYRYGSLRLSRRRPEAAGARGDDADESALIARMEAMAPSREQRQAMRQKSRPPQSWYDEQDPVGPGTQG